MPDQEHFQDLEFPIRGIDTSSEFSSQLSQTTIFGLNVRVQDILDRRDRGGSRPGLKRYFPNQIQGNESLVQHLNFIVDPEAAALGLDDDSDRNPDIQYMDDPSTSNLSQRIPRTATRRIRVGGSGLQPNRKFPKNDYQIFWDNPQAIAQGTAISGTQLNAQAVTVGDGVTLQHSGLAVNGTYSYDPDVGYTPPKGTYNLRVDFKPQDGNYPSFKPKSKTVVLKVKDTANEATTYQGAFNGQGPASPPALDDEDYILVNRIVTNTDTSTVIENTSLGERLLIKRTDGIDTVGQSVEVEIPENHASPWGYRGNGGS